MHQNTRSKTKKMGEVATLKSYFESQFSKLQELISGNSDAFNQFKEEINNKLNDLSDKIETKVQQLEQDKVLLQNQVQELKNVNNKLGNYCDELEQYGRRVCLRVDGVPVEENETAEDVFKKVETLCQEAEVNVPESALDRAHRIGHEYYDRSTKTKCKSIIIRFTTFRHRTLLYRARKKIKNNVRIKLDLTKKRYSVLKLANDYVKSFDHVKFCLADINCRLKVKWDDDSENFFDSFEELKSLVEAR